MGARRVGLVWGCAIAVGGCAAGVGEAAPLLGDVDGERVETWTVVGTGPEHVDEQDVEQPTVLEARVDPHATARPAPQEHPSVEITEGPSPTPPPSEPPASTPSTETMPPPVVTAPPPIDCASDPWQTGVDRSLALFEVNAPRAGIDGVLATATKATLLASNSALFGTSVPYDCTLYRQLATTFGGVLPEPDEPAIPNDPTFSDFFVGLCESGSCRVGALLWRIMATACDRREADCDEEPYAHGVVNAQGYIATAVCPGTKQQDEFSEIHTCLGSPLVIDTGGDGIDLVPTAAGPIFPMIPGAELRTGWIAPGDDALLALDRDHSGAIESGRELFGEGTDLARDGHDALSRLDANHDGVIDARDPAFDALRLWLDDGDGFSQPSELATLAGAGLRAISLQRTAQNAQHPSGNVLGDTSRAIREDGRTVEVVDVWFALRSD